MRQKSDVESSSERMVKNIRRATRKHYSAEDKIRIVLDGLRGEASIAELCRSEGIAESLYYTWSKEFLEAGKRRLAGDTARAATSGEVKDLRRQAQDLKEVVAENQRDRFGCDPLAERLRARFLHESMSNRKSPECSIAIIHDVRHTKKRKSVTYSTGRSS